MSMQRRQTALALATVLSLALVFFGATSATAQSAEDSIEQLEAGQAVYEGSCAGCHSVDGSGSDRGRPLTGIASQEPDRSIHFASIKDGKGNMPAFGERLSDDEIDAATSYVRLTFVAEAAQSAAADDAGSTEELAVTGVESGLLIVVGATMLIAGLLFYRTRRDLIV